GVAQLRERIRGIADAVNRGGEAEAPDRFQKIGAQRVAAFAVAPVADPDQVAPGDDLRMRAEHAGIRRLVPSEDLPPPALPAIELRQHLAEGEDAVIAVEIEAGYVRAGRDRAVMRVVEQQRIGRS